MARVEYLSSSLSARFGKVSSDSVELLQLEHASLQCQLPDGSFESLTQIRFLDLWHSSEQRTN